MSQTRSVKLAKQKEWRQKNADRIYELNKAYRLANPDKQKSYQRKYYENHPIQKTLSSRRHSLMRWYGITIDKYNEMFDSQKGCCAICGVHQCNQSLTLGVDHCHKTKQVRGLLCFECNTALGRFDDNPSMLLKAVEYLKKYNG